MKKHFLMALVLLMGVSAMAQETETPVQDSHWHSKGNIGLNFSQGAYSNWAAGGQNTLAWLGTFNYSINYAKNNFKWNNTLNAALGYSFFDFKKDPLKTDDMIEFTSLAGLKATQTLNYSVELAFRSQFANGYAYDIDSTNYISKFLAPAYISLGVGMEWVPNEYFSLYFSPLTGRVTIVNDDRLAEEGAFGVNELDKNDTIAHAKYNKIRYEFGARAVAKFQYPIYTNINFNSKLELFSNYLKDPQYIDVDWQNMLVLKVNSWLNANVATHLIYDRDIPFYDEKTGERIEGSKVQFKEVLSIGFMINL